MFSKQENAEQPVKQQLTRLADSIEALLSYSGNPSDNPYLALRLNAEQALSDARESLKEPSGGLVKRICQAVSHTHAYVNHSPWKSVVIGWATGVVCGWLCARR